MQGFGKIACELLIEVSVALNWQSGEAGASGELSGGEPEIMDMKVQLAEKFFIQQR